MSTISPSKLSNAIWWMWSSCFPWKQQKSTRIVTQQTGPSCCQLICRYPMSLRGRALFFLSSQSPLSAKGLLTWFQHPSFFCYPPLLVVQVVPSFFWFIISSRMMTSFHSSLTCQYNDSAKILKTLPHRHQHGCIEADYDPPVRSDLNSGPFLFLFYL
jgi:hypothetical protein